MATPRKREIILMLGIEAGGFRRNGREGVDMTALDAADLGQAQKLSAGLASHSENPHIRLLQIDARSLLDTVGSGWIRMPARARSIASLMADVSVLGIADGAVVSVGPATDTVKLSEEIADDLNRHGYDVIDRITGWVADGWTSCPVHSLTSSS